MRSHHPAADRFRHVEPVADGPAGAADLVADDFFALCHPSGDHPPLDLVGVLDRERSYVEAALRVEGLGEMNSQKGFGEVGHEAH
jgi:hypothetical protein